MMREGDKRRRYRNNPPIRVIIQEYLAQRSVASFADIYAHVTSQNVKLTSKTPKNSVVCVLVRMDNVERVSRATYSLRRNRALEKGHG